MNRSLTGSTAAASNTSMKAIFFDAAGTLVQVREPVGVTYARIAASHGIVVGSDEITRAFRSTWKSLPQPQHEGKPAADDDRGWWRELVRRCFAEVIGTELPTAKLDALFANLYSHFARPDAWSVFDDVVPALTQLGRSHRLFVLSNFDQRLRSILDGHDLARHFESIIISSEFGASKPDARIFLAAAALANAAPADCLHIGDDKHFDLAGAHAAGFAARLVRRPDCGLDDISREVMSRTVL